MKNIKVNIMAAGSGKRWGDYLGIPKQLIEINGETLLERIRRQLKERGIDDITISYKPYFFEIDCNLRYQEQTEIDIDRFLGARGFDLYLYGDVYYSNNAIDSILKRKTKFYGRKGPSKVKKHGEIFAVWFDNELWKSAERVKELYLQNKIKRCLGWELYRCSQNIPISKHIVKKDFTEINDETDDFDFPKDLTKWKRRYLKKRR